MAKLNHKLTHKVSNTHKINHNHTHNPSELTHDLQRHNTKSSNTPRAQGSQTAGRHALGGKQQASLGPASTARQYSVRIASQGDAFIDSAQ